MPKVGILGCEATTRDMDCVKIGCFGKRVDHPAGSRPQKMNDLVFKRIKVHTEENESD